MPLAVHVAYVAGLKPAVFHHSTGCLRVIVVAAHDVRAAHENLSIFGYPDIDSGKDQTHRAGLVVVGSIRGDDAGFSHAEALKDGDVRSPESVRERGRKGCAARNEVTQTASDARAPFREDEAARKLMLEFKQRRHRLSLIFQLGVTLADFERPREQLGFPAPGGHAFFDDALVDLFKQARHGGHNRGAHIVQMFADLIERSGVVDGDARAAEDVKNRALEDVREWENRKSDV